MLYTPDGRIKVLDFGIARRIRTDLPLAEAGETTHLTQAGALVGTGPYMSPEQIRGGRADVRSDIWSFGCLMYELLAGRAAFARETLADTLSAVIEHDPDLGALPAATPSAIRDLARRCLNKNPADRPRSAAEIKDRIGEVIDRLKGVQSPAVARRRMLLAASALVIAVLGLFVAWPFYQRSQVRWVQAVAIPEIERLAGTGSQYGPSLSMWQAHELAEQAAGVVADDSVIHELWSQVARELSVETDPPGARVYAKPYPLTDAERVLLGTTPIESVWLPFGYHRLWIEKEGYRGFEGLTPPRGSRPVSVSMPEDGVVPEEMVVVAGGNSPLFLPGLDHLNGLLGPFLMDRYEVTNRQYKRFVDAGGYTNREYWHHPFVGRDRTLSWEEAMASLVDSTGRPGPSTWEVSDYPEHEGDYPVSGVSWYEAGAYAAFADKDLPTVFHWNHAATTPSGVEILPLSNLGGDRPWPVESSQAINSFGTYDMAGNVREWVFNSTGAGEQRYLLGGGWNDPDYLFMDAYAASAFDRSPTNGIRLIRYLEPEENLEALTRPLDRPFRDFLSERPVSDETFEIFLRQFGYDDTGLDAEIEEEVDGEDWARQEVSFSASYGGERMAAVVLLPKMATPPWQAVIIFPGSSALNRASPDSFIPAIDFLVKSGRAVVIPAYKSTYGRQDELKSDYPDETNFWKEHVIMWVKDFARTIDYLETRDDIDADKVAYYGFSWGGAQGNIVPAVEKRLKASVLYNAGLQFQRALPEVDQINYVGRVTLPVLMVNGDHDFIYPVETSQRPMFELLGTPAGDKKRVTYPGSHWAPRSDLIRETLAWLGRYLGPVEQ